MEAAGGLGKTRRASDYSRATVYEPHRWWTSPLKCKPDPHGPRWLAARGAWFKPPAGARDDADSKMRARTSGRRSSRAQPGDGRTCGHARGPGEDAAPPNRFNPTDNRQ